MNNQLPQLKFQCPKKWNEMTNAENGRFCDECNKVVLDFSNMSPEKINAVISTSKLKNDCGNFYTHQISPSYGNWKDKVITFYQATYTKINSKNRLSKQLVLFLLAILLFSTGCHRQVRGKMKPYTKNDSQKIQNQ